MSEEHAHIVPYKTFFSIWVALLILTGVTFYLIVPLLGIRRAQSAEEKLTLKRRVDAFDEWSVVKDRRAFYTAVVLVIAVLLLFAVSDVLGVGLKVFLQVPLDPLPISVELLWRHIRDFARVHEGLNLLHILLGPIQHRFLGREAGRADHDEEGNTGDRQWD